MTIEEMKGLGDVFDKAVTKMQDGVKSQYDGLKTEIATLKDSKVEEKDEEAELEASGIAGTMEKVMNWKLMDIPVGQAFLGGFAAVFVTELIDGAMVTKSAMWRGVVKLILAGVTVKFGKKFLGSTGGNTVALLLTFDAIKDLLPKWYDVAKGASIKIAGAVPTGGLHPIVMPQTALPANTRVISGDYYAKAFGR